jgi:hypothetical protein
MTGMVIYRMTKLVTFRMTGVRAYGAKFMIVTLNLTVILVVA